MIPVLAKLMKPLTEVWTSYNESYAEIHSAGGDLTGDIAREKYNDGPKMYAMKNLNLSLLSLPVNDLSNLILESAHPCSRPLHCSAPYV